MRELKGTSLGLKSWKLACEDDSAVAHMVKRDESMFKYNGFDDDPEKRPPKTTRMESTTGIAPR